jgi:hypothetical protein
VPWHPFEDEELTYSEVAPASRDTMAESQKYKEARA